MKKIVVIDGQGGKIGSLLVSRLKAQADRREEAGRQERAVRQGEAGRYEVYAIGTNGIATSAMMKAGADYGATGENPVIVNCRDADIIVGPIGIVVADSLFGEITPPMAVAVGQSAAKKVLLPINRCNNHVVGANDLPISELIDAAIEHILSVL